MSYRESRNARAFASAQRSYDNMTPEDVYGPDDPEEEEHLCSICGEQMEHLDGEWVCPPCLADKENL